MPRQTVIPSRNNTCRENSRGPYCHYFSQPMICKRRELCFNVQYVLHVVKQVLNMFRLQYRGQWKGPCIFLYMILPKINFKNLSPLLHKLIWTFPQVLQWTHIFGIWMTVLQFYYIFSLKVYFILKVYFVLILHLN